MYQDRIGKGSKILDAEKLYTQGNLKLTGVNYDMALSGDGFFTVLNNRSSGSSETLYTRAGNFRMGDNGTLQDAAGNEVQGWMMTPIDNQNDVTSTNPNSKVFSEDFTKLLGSKVIKHDTYVETITAKATDYASTAKSDSATVFSGAGLKTKSSKIADIEAAITDYTNWLQKLKEEPDGLSATSISQISQINFKTGSAGIISKEGDQVYAYINGNKYSQNYKVTTSTAAQRTELYNYDQNQTPAGAFGFLDPDDVLNPLSNAQIAAYDQAVSRIATYKEFSDKLSTISGLVATMSSESGGANNDVLEGNDTFNLSTKLGDMYKGIIQIKSLIPGKEFTITEVGEISSNTTSQGYYLTSTSATAGSGIGALESSRNALSKLITGKQQDVYRTTEMGGFPSDFTYGINIYDKELDKAIPVPNTGGTIPQDDPIIIEKATSIDNFIEKFNTQAALKTPKLTDYVEAVNINGSLVIKTLDKNYDVEFSGILKAGALNDDLTITGSGTTSASVAIGAVSDNTTYKMTINGTTVSYTSGTGADEDSIVNGLKTAITPTIATAMGITVDGITPAFTIASTPDVTITPVSTNLSTSGVRPASVTIDTVSDDTDYTMTINGRTVSYTSGTGADEDSIVTGLKAAITSASPAIPGITFDGVTPAFEITYTPPVTVLEVNTLSQNTFTPKDKATDFSGRAGAGAEFIEIINKVDQTASKGSLQLRLDTLGISDTAFGEFSVDSTGLITMKQDGAEFAIGQVAIALFNNNQGLEPGGDNLLTKTNESGEPIYNINNNKTAKIEGKTLELSTADLSESLVNLMVFQRAFEANAKSITTSDELLNTLINLKR
jgi:flagellar hook protein FlgE